MSLCWGELFLRSKKSLEGGASYGVRSVLANFPLLESSERDWQAGVC